MAIFILCGEPQAHRNSGEKTGTGSVLSTGSEPFPYFSVNSVPVPVLPASRDTSVGDGPAHESAGVTRIDIICPSQSSLSSLRFSGDSKN